MQTHTRRKRSHSKTIAVVLCKHTYTSYTIGGRRKKQGLNLFKQKDSFVSTVCIPHTHTHSEDSSYLLFSICWLSISVGREKIRRKTLKTTIFKEVFFYWESFLGLKSNRNVNWLLWKLIAESQKSFGFQLRGFCSASRRLRVVGRN